MYAPKHIFIISGLAVCVIVTAALFVFRENFFTPERTNFGIEPKQEEDDVASQAEVLPEKSVEVEEKEQNENLVEEEPKEDSELLPSAGVSTTPLFNIFEKAIVAPDVFLDGKGKNIDSPEFFETDDYRESLLLVSGKGNDLVEVWKYPFVGNEQSPLKRDSLPNGLIVDQKRDWLIIGDSEEKEAVIYTLPELQHIKNIGRGKLGDGETNGDILARLKGSDILYVTESHRVMGFDLENGKEVVSFSPRVESIEEVLADDYHEIVYVPEENGKKSKLYHGGAITAYTSLGKPFLKNGTNVFGKGVFGGDGEGAALYKCLDKNKQDTGYGFLIFADQGGSRENGLEFFNRETWKHLGTLSLSGVSQTDGITSTQFSFPQYPLGILAVSNNDKNTALISWEKILAVTKLSCN